MNPDLYVVIEYGASGRPRIHGPFDTLNEAEHVKRTWSWSRWTNKLEIAVLGNPKNAAYSSMKGRGFNIKKVEEPNAE